MDSIDFQIAKFAVFLDTNVLYSSHLRDLILRLAAFDTFRVHWSRDVLNEHRDCLLMRAGVTSEKVDRLHEQMTRAFPHALVEEYKSMLVGISLPDPTDVHVVAAAVKGRCDLILTANLKDFPPVALESFEISAQHPDVFLGHHMSLEKEITLKVVKGILLDMAKPKLSFEDYIERLEHAGLVTFTESLKDVKDLLT